MIWPGEPPIFTAVIAVGLSTFDPVVRIQVVHEHADTKVQRSKVFGQREQVPDILHWPLERPQLMSEASRPILISNCMPEKV